MSSSSSKKPSSSKSSSSEKRLARTRSKCPLTLKANMTRALKEDFCILELPKLSPDWSDNYCQPTTDRSDWAMDIGIVGSTGNVYNVVLDFCPSCTCPNFSKKADICKHIFYVLLRVVGLPTSSSIIYQKAYVRTELLTILGNLAVARAAFKSRGSLGSSTLAPKSTKEVYQRRLSTSNGISPKNGLKAYCCVCDRRIKSSQTAVYCPTKHCGEVFHLNCIETMPDMSYLSLTHVPKNERFKTKRLECPLCLKDFEYDEGYINVAGVTGHACKRDKSSYRPCPGYPTYYAGQV